MTNRTAGLSPSPNVVYGAAGVPLVWASSSLLWCCLSCLSVSHSQSVVLRFCLIASDTCCALLYPSLADSSFPQLTSFDENTCHYVLSLCFVVSLSTNPRAFSPGPLFLCSVSVSVSVLFLALFLSPLTQCAPPPPTNCDGSSALPPPH